MPRKGKCFSTCRKRPQPECDHPLCQYTNGSRYQYCRLKHTYKMNAACEPELRTRKGTQKNQKPPVVEEPREIIEFRERVQKTAATRKIKKFMKKHKNKRRAHYLKSICSDAGVCIAFGTESEKIKKHFDHFDNFQLLSKPARRIGFPSANGFVKELTYENEGYVANAVLKSTHRDTADNLLYEGIVGRYLTKVGRQFPCFVETYGIYKYEPGAYDAIKSHVETSPSVLHAGLSKIHQLRPFDIGFACENPTYMAVLIQHLHNANTLLEKMFAKTTKQQFMSEELLYVLYQIYMPLACLGKHFTHYDLHANNVIVYEPIVGQYIHYHYHTGDKGEVVHFKSRYMAKMIDYGSCYYDDVDGIGFSKSSKRFYVEICNTKKCKDCGQTQGFKALEYDAKVFPKNEFKCATQPNQSYDLGLLYMLASDAKKNPGSVSLSMQHILEKVVFGEGVPIEKLRKEYMEKHPHDAIFHGTKENTTSGLPEKINNITDAYMELERLIMDPRTQSINDNAYETLTKIGDLHIYDNGRPMNYIPA